MEDLAFEGKIIGSAVCVAAIFWFAAEDKVKRILRRSFNPNKKKNQKFKNSPG